MLGNTARMFLTATKAINNYDDEQAKQRISDWLDQEEKELEEAKQAARSLVNDYIIKHQVSHVIRLNVYIFTNVVAELGDVLFLQAQLCCLNGFLISRMLEEECKDRLKEVYDMADRELIIKYAVEAVCKSNLSKTYKTREHLGIRLPLDDDERSISDELVVRILTTGDEAGKIIKPKHFISKEDILRCGDLINAASFFKRAEETLDKKIGILEGDNLAKLDEYKLKAYNAKYLMHKWKLDVPIPIFSKIDKSLQFVVQLAYYEIKSKTLVSAVVASYDEKRSTYDFCDYNTKTLSQIFKCFFYPHDVFNLQGEEYSYLKLKSCESIVSDENWKARHKSFLSFTLGKYNTLYSTATCSSPWSNTYNSPNTRLYIGKFQEGDKDLPEYISDEEAFSVFTWDFIHRYVKYSSSLYVKVIHAANYLHFPVEDVDDKSKIFEVRREGEWTILKN